MDRLLLENLLQQIKGCTFASIDAETTPTPGYTKFTERLSVILFTNSNFSGYEAMLHRRLLAAGKNPQDFSLGDLPWGTRVPNSPLVENKGKTYLQCIVISPGVERIVNNITQNEVTAKDLGLREHHKQYGLTDASKIVVKCYDIENITRIALMGEEIVAEKPKRAILRLPG
jgi:hypothetical protein